MKPLAQGHHNVAIRALGAARQIKVRQRVTAERSISLPSALCAGDRFVAAEVLAPLAGKDNDFQAVRNAQRGALVGVKRSIRDFESS